MGIISVIEYGCDASVSSLDDGIRERMRLELFPHNTAAVEVSFDPENNTLDLTIRIIDTDDESAIHVSIPPDRLVVKLLGMFVEINDRSLRELAESRTD